VVGGLAPRRLSSLLALITHRIPKTIFSDSSRRRRWTKTWLSTRATILHARVVLNSARDRKGQSGKVLKSCHGIADWRSLMETHRQRVRDIKQTPQTVTDISRMWSSFCVRYFETDVLSCFATVCRCI